MIRGHPYISWHLEGGLSQSVITMTAGGGLAQVSSRNLMVGSYYACFRPVILLFRPTNCDFVIGWMILTKNMKFIAKIAQRNVKCNSHFKRLVRKAFFDTIFSLKRGAVQQISWLSAGGVWPKCQLTVSRGGRVVVYVGNQQIGHFLSLFRHCLTHNFGICRFFENVVAFGQIFGDQNFGVP